MKINVHIEIDTADEADGEGPAVRLADALAILSGHRVIKIEEVDMAAAHAELARFRSAYPDIPEAYRAAGAQPSAAPTEQKPARTRRTKAEMEAAAAPAPEQQTELPVEEPAPAPAEPAPAPAATPAVVVPDFAAVKAAAVDLVNKHGGEIQSALTKFISVQFKDADGNPARLFTLTDDGRAKTMATVQACAALADKDAILKHLAV